MNVELVAEVGDRRMPGDSGGPVGRGREGGGGWEPVTAADEGWRLVELDRFPRNRNLLPDPPPAPPPPPPPAAATASGEGCISDGEVEC